MRRSVTPVEGEKMLNYRYEKNGVKNISFGVFTWNWYYRRQKKQQDIKKDLTSIKKHWYT